MRLCRWWMVAEVDIGGPEHGLLEVLEQVEETRH